MDISIFKKSGIDDFKLKPIKSDASFRKYFRVYIKNEKKELLLVNSPKKTENNLGYLKATKILERMNKEFLGYDREVLLSENATRVGVGKYKNHKMMEMEEFNENGGIYGFP